MGGEWLPVDRAEGADLARHTDCPGCGTDVRAFPNSTGDWWCHACVKAWAPARIRLGILSLLMQIPLPIPHPVTHLKEDVDVRNVTLDAKKKNS